MRETAYPEKVHPYVDGKNNLLLPKRMKDFQIQLKNILSTEATFRTLNLTRLIFSTLFFTLTISQTIEYIAKISSCLWGENSIYGFSFTSVKKTSATNYW